MIPMATTATTKTTIDFGKDLIREWKYKRFTVKDEGVVKTYRTNTKKPKGKIGKLVDNNWLDFGQKKFEFRKFGANKSTFEDSLGFIAALEKRGFEKLGSGAFSTVLAKKGYDRVIKVIRRPDGWIDYVHWASKLGEEGKFAPKVYSYKKIKGKKKDFSVAIMERLEYTFAKAPADHALSIIPQLMQYSSRNPMAASFMDILAPGLGKFMIAMKKEFEEGGFDMHSGNVMVRKDGSFVLSDPIASGSKTDYKRLKAGDFSPALTINLFIVTGFSV